VKAVGDGPAGATNLQHSPSFMVDWSALPVTSGDIRVMLHLLLIRSEFLFQRIGITVQIEMVALNI
jgi:hypothetical protein